MKVRAKTMGFYGGARIRPGTVFELSPSGKLGSWMEPVEDDARTAEPKPKRQKPVALQDVGKEGLSPEVPQ